MNQVRMFTLVKILALFGLVLGAYLMWQQLYRPAFQPCSINAFVNCDAVVSGPLQKTLGIPTPLYGLIGYVVIFFAAVVKNKKLLFAVATFGLLFCAYIAYVELFVLRVICPVCIGCQLDMIAVFVLSILLVRHKGSSANLTN